MVPDDHTEACQPRQPYNMQSLQELGADLIHPQGASTADLFNSPGNLSPSDGRVQHKVLWLCLLFGMRECSAPPALKPMWKELCFLLLSRWTVCQNFFGVDWKCFSMASSHTWVFASVTA